MGAEQQEATLSTFGWFLHLFFSRKFIVHRLTGLIYLILYALTFAYYFVDYEGFKNSPIVWVLPSVGLFQSITAIYTFTFLPKSTKDGGYFGDKGILSYNFIVENSFFELILLFQWIYYNDAIYGILRSTVVIENFFVFLPYIIRSLWPKTSIRDALDNPKNKSARNFNFFMIVTWITKIFYVWAKHYIGYFLNYVRFLDRVSEEEKYHIYLLLIFSAFATTISMFLHTLKFKHYMDPRVSFLIYQASYFATFYSFYQISGIFFANLDLTILTLGGLLLNFTDIKYQHAYQVLVLGVLNAVRYGALPQTIL
jgi:hypothetical protein